MFTRTCIRELRHTTGHVVGVLDRTTVHYSDPTCVATNSVDSGSRTAVYVFAYDRLRRHTLGGIDRPARRAFAVPTRREVEPTVKWLTLAVALLAACSTGQADPSSRTASIGGKEFRLPAPAGYVDFCSQDREAAEVIALEVPPVNEFLDCYTTPGDLEAWTARAGGVFESYVTVSVMKSTIGRTVSPAEFAAFRRRMNAQVSTLHEEHAALLEGPVEEFEKAISAKEGVTIRVEPGQIVPLGVFDEADNYIASAWLASKQIFVDDKQARSSKVSISTAVLVRGKVLVLSTIGEYRQASDIERYQDMARAWRAQVIAENT